MIAENRAKTLTQQRAEIAIFSRAVFTVCPPVSCKMTGQTLRWLARPSLHRVPAPLSGAGQLANVGQTASFSGRAAAVRPASCSSLAARRSKSAISAPLPLFPCSLFVQQPQVFVSDGVLHIGIVAGAVNAGLQAALPRVRSRASNGRSEHGGHSLRPSCVHAGERRKPGEYLEMPLLARPASLNRDLALVGYEPQVVLPTAR